MFNRSRWTSWGALLLSAFWGGTADSEEIRLFNGKDLEGWTFTVDEHSPQGIDASEDDVFQVRKGVVVCRGYPYGVLQHEAAFQDYALTLKWAWTPSIAGTSAVFVHAGSEQDATGFPKSCEISLFRDNAGNIFFRTYQAAELFENDWAFHRKVQADVENEMGQWNQLEVICHGNTVTAYVNGKAVNQVNDYPEMPSGSIALQSRGSTIFFTDVKVTRPLTEEHFNRERAASRLFAAELAAQQAKKDAKVNAARAEQMARQRLEEEDQVDPAEGIEPEIEFTRAATALPFPPDAYGLKFDESLDEIELKSGSSLRALARFYRVEMARRGWQEQRDAAVSDDDSVEMTFQGGGTTVTVDINQYSSANEVDIEGEGLDFKGTQDPAGLVALGIPQDPRALFLQKEIMTADASDVDFQPSEVTFSTSMKPKPALKHFRDLFKEKGFQETDKPTLEDDYSYAEFEKDAAEMIFYVFDHPVGSRLLFRFRDDEQAPDRPPLADTPAEAWAKRARDEASGQSEPAPNEQPDLSAEAPQSSADAPRVIDVTSNQGTATVVHGVQRQTFKHVAAFQSQARPEAVEVVFSSRPIPFDRLQKLVAAEDYVSFGDLFEFDFPSFIVVDVGQSVGFSYTSEGTGISRGVNNATNKTYQSEGRIHGEIAMAPEEIFDKPFSFSANFNAAIMTPQTKLSDARAEDPSPVLDVLESVPFPDDGEDVVRSGSRYRKEHRATSNRTADQINAFYRKAMGSAAGWKEVSGDSGESLTFRSTGKSMTVNVSTQGQRQYIVVVVHDVAGAERDGILPEPEKGRLIMVNGHTAEVTYSIGKRDYRMRAGRGYEHPEEAFNYTVTPATYPVVVKMPGKPERTEKIRIAPGETWAIIATPGGGYTVVHMY